MSGKGNEGLDKAILDAARLMRHDGLRLVISTQSPKALNPEILELVSVAILHRFQSRDWFNYLQSKIEFEFDFETIKTLAPGSAVVFAGRRLFSGDLDYLTYEKNFLMQVRPRITQDRGSSLVNKGQEVNSALNEVPNISHVDLESEDYSTSNNLISFTQSSEIDSDISKAELMDDLEVMKNLVPGNQF